MDPEVAPIAEAIASTLLHDLILLGIAIFTAITATIGAFKANKVEKSSKVNSEAITRLELTVDGRLTQLLELTKASSFAAGQKDEASSGTIRTDVAAASAPSAEITEVVTAAEGQELVIRAEGAKVETEKGPSKGDGDLIIKAEGAKIEAKEK